MILDANWIFNYCLSAVESWRVKYKGKRIQPSKLANETRKKIQRVLGEKEKIRTIEPIWREVEQKPLEEVIDKHYPRLSWRIKRLMATKLERELQKLRNKRWFEIVKYSTTENQRQIVSELYELPEAKGVIKHKGPPSEADKSLLTYTIETKLPLATQDQHLLCLKQTVESRFGVKMLTI